MIVDVVMPKLGESITEGTILQWQKKIGETVRKDETLLEIGTDKVDSEIPSPATGVVVELLYNPNDVVPVSQVIAKIETEAELGVKEPPEKVVPDKVGKDKPTESVTEVSPPTKEQIEKTISTSITQKKRSFYSPLVRSIARQEGISDEELAIIPGSGKEGRVTKRDILAYLEQRQFAPGAEVPILEIPPVEVPEIERVLPEEKTVEMDRVHQLIAQHMRESLDTAAHVHLVSECDVTAITNFIKTRDADFQKREGFKLTYTPFFILAAVKAIQDFPIFNTSLNGIRIIYKKNINIGLAVASENSLLVPVIQKCDEMNFLGICRKTNDLTVRTRNGKISADELQNSTFTITNYGIFGNLFGTPIINQPNTSILGIGTVKKRPVVWELEGGDTIIIRSMVYLSLGFDHRLIDGAGAGKFLKKIVEYLENMDTSMLL